DDIKLHRKHTYAIDLIAKGGSAVPELVPIAASMGKSDMINAIRAALMRVKAKPADNVTPVLVQPGSERSIFLEEPSWHDWWRSFWPTLLASKKKAGRATKVA